MAGEFFGYIIALDVGTTTVKCHVVDTKSTTVGSAHIPIILHYPKPGYVEIIPDELLNVVVEVVKRAVIDANISFAEVKSLGISTQRGTFLTWRKDTGEPLHNFITWKDLRASKLCKDVNSYFSTNVIRWSAYVSYLLTRNTKFWMGSKLEFSSKHVSIRLMWILQNNKYVQEAVEQNNLMFGTIETWLIYKFTDGAKFITDITNASATGFYDPFDLDWGFVANLLCIPKNILPLVVDNDYNFGMVKEKFFGVPIKIGCVMSDQSASMFGSCCFSNNDVKVSIGTGAFLDVNTYNTIQPSLNGMYPLVGWKINNKLVYMSEVPCTDAGSLIQWILNLGLIDDPSQSSEMAYSVKDNDGVYFIPAFSGLGPPINNEKAATGFIGIKPTTLKAHIIRAILESICYQITLSYEFLKRERSNNYKTIRINGGVSKNNFICQMLANLTNVIIERQSSEMSLLGVAFLSGLSSGIWKDENDLQEIHKIEDIFNPSNSVGYRKKCREELNQWMLAAKRFKSWYKEN